MMKTVIGFPELPDLETTINRWIDRLAAAIRNPEHAETQTLLRHLKGIRTHVIGFLDALEKLITPSSNGK